MESSDNQSIGGWLDAIPATVHAIGDLIDKVWDKSPYLGHVLVLLVAAFPFYLVYTWGNIGKAEKKIDQQLSTAKAKRKVENKGLEEA